MCRVFGVSRSGFYEWLSRPESARKHADRQLSGKIKQAFEDSRQTYGTRRIQDALDPQGQRVSRARIGRLMRQQGLRCKTRRRFRATTNANPSLPVAPNHLNRQFQVAEPDRADVGDITYGATGEGWLYLAVFLDRFSRQVVGWALSAWMTADLGLDALQMARWRRRPGKGLLVHSDRGSQYASGRFHALLKDQGYVCSMSRKGNCWDNAPAESFFPTLQTELIHQRRFETREQAKQEIFEYIEVFYNRQRKHSTLGYRTPAEFDTLHRKAA
ncbi:IS3 family transposase [Methylococcus capsulatus]|uniref:IS3 family transposase n=2 Tax=Methylococcus capsulatus TaxID=414 RepID=A0ABZ2F9X4_METCP